MRHPSADSSWFRFETPAESGFRVYAFTGTEEIHKPYEFDIELVHESASIDLATLLGHFACLTITDKSGGVRHVHGVIRRFEQLHTSNYRTHYRCLLVPRLWFLGQVTDHRIFQNLSVPQIIEQILKEQNFTGDSYAFKCFFDYAPREYCVQYGETSLHFISRLCEEEGMYFYFEHERNRHVLCFSDREGGPRIAGESDLRFHPGAGTQTDTATVRTLAFHQAIGSDAVTFREWNFEKTRLDLQVEQLETDALKAPVPAGMTLERYGYPHLYQLQKDGKRYASIEMLRHMSLSRYMEAGTDVSRMVPGFTFELFGHDRAELNTCWWVVRVEQQGEQPQVLEHEAPDRGMTYAAKVLAIPNTTRFVPASAHPRNRIVGTQTAIVTGPDGEEIFPDQYGRVKVQFHWDRLGRRDENTTCWMRVSQAWAGGQFGTMAIPRIGQEVAVSFLEGDPDRPIITGRVYNSANPVPYPLPEHKTRTVFKSLSSPGGGGFNELRVEDKKGQEEIYAHAEKDVNVYVKNDWKEHILHDQHRTVDNFSYSLIKGEDQQTVHLDRKVELLSDDHLTVKGDSHARYGDKWLLRTGDEVHINAGRIAVIEAGTELTIKGAGSFIRLDPSGATIMGSKVKINSGGSPGSGTGARPLLPEGSRLPEKGTVPLWQKANYDAARKMKLPFGTTCPFKSETGKAVPETDQQNIAILHATSSNNSAIQRTEGGKLFFAIYYVVNDNAFQKATETWRESIGLKEGFENSIYYMSIGVKTESQFKNAWKTIYNTSVSKKYDIVEGRLFVHASLGHGDAQGLEFQAEYSDDAMREYIMSDSTLRYFEMNSLEVLPWDSKGILWIHGCNTGVERDGWSPAQAFADRQGIITCGTLGYAYFSEQYDFYDRQDSFGHDPLYLRAFKRRLNVKDGEDATGIAIQEKRFVPCR